MNLVQPTPAARLPKRVPPDRAAFGQKLTRMEAIVMALVCDGLTHKQIAQRLYISVKTVDKHTIAIRTKWGVHSSLQILRHAVLHDLYVIRQWEGNPS